MSVPIDALVGDAVSRILGGRPFALLVFQPCDSAGVNVQCVTTVPHVTLMPLLSEWIMANLPAEDATPPPPESLSGLG